MGKKIKIKNLDANDVYPYHKPDKIYLSEYVKNSPYMHTENNKICVKLRCENRILDDVIERFGECRLSEDGSDHFIATIPKTTYLGMKYWILAFTSACVVLEPENLRDDVKMTLTRALTFY
jgi:predicted DNA-binding transcriptional regulator YafY